MNKQLILVLALVEIVWLVGSTANVERIRVESCSGCKLNRLHDVKKFIYEDIPKYENVEFKPIHGASPIMILLGEDDTEIDRISLEPLSREECNEKLAEFGFYPKEKKEL